MFHLFTCLNLKAISQSIQFSLTFFLTPPLILFLPDIMDPLMDKMPFLFYLTYQLKKNFKFLNLCPNLKEVIMGLIFISD